MGKYLPIGTKRKKPEDRKESKYSALWGQPNVPKRTFGCVVLRLLKRDRKTKAAETAIPAAIGKRTGG
jgi:hypothetical protein